MFGTRLIDRNPALFQPRVAPEPEVQERLQERIRAVTLQMQRRAGRYPRWVDFGTESETGVANMG